MTQHFDPTAIVEDPSTIGEDVKIWHHTHVVRGAVIGARAMLAQGCYVAATVKIGAGCRVQNHVSLYDGVILEDDVFLGPSCVFTNVKYPRAAIAQKDAYLPTLVKRGATIGANATIVCGVTIGEYAMIGAGAVVTHDVPAHAVAAGVPATIRGAICACGTPAPTGSIGEVTCTACSACGRSYQHKADELVEA